MYLAATRPAEIVVIDQAAPTLPPRHELIFDKKVAWDHYQKFIKAEKKLRRRRVQYDAQEFFGDASEWSMSIVFVVAYKFNLTHTHTQRYWSGWW